MEFKKLKLTFINFSDSQEENFFHAFKHTCGISLRLKHDQLITGTSHYPVLVTPEQYKKINKARQTGVGVLLKMTPDLMYAQVSA